MRESGSAHNKSQSKPVSGTSVGLWIWLICEIVVNYGDNPPCIQIILS